MLNDRREFPADGGAVRPRTDLAVLKKKIDTKGEKLPVLPIADRDDAPRSATWCWPLATPSASARP